MNTFPTYKESYDKIIQAYFNNEIKVFDPEFCFCGTLCGGMKWIFPNKYFPSYTYAEYGRMERALFSAFPNISWSNNGEIDDSKFVEDEHFEDYIFNGMCAALEVLKQIHIEHGETINESPSFEKRVLVG